MKKLLYLFAALAIFSGCEQMEGLDQPVQGGTEENVGDLPTVIYATVDDESANVKTRTYADGKTILWHGGDAISYIGPNAYRAKYQYDGEDGVASAEFTPKETGNVPSGAVKPAIPFAVYPYNSGAYCKQVDGVNTLVVNFPTVQNYAPNSFGRDANIMVGVGESADDIDFYFCNACGYLVIKLLGTDVAVKTIELTALGGEKLSGTGYISASYGEAPVVTMDDNAKSTVTLNCGEGVALNATTATEFWFTLPPVTFNQGFKIHVTPTVGSAFEVQTSKRVEITRNDIQPMVALQFTPNWPASNQLVYTLSEGSTATLLDKFKVGENTYFDATIKSHEYDSNNNRYVIEFNSALTTIKKDAFKSADIATIVFPQTLTTIGYEAFCNSKVTAITFPGSVTQIGQSAFTGCVNLTSVTFEPSPTKAPVKVGVHDASHSIYGPFFNCALEHININRAFETTYNEATFVPGYSTNGLFSTGTTEKQYTTTVVIGEQVPQIYEYMFGNRPITTITIPAHISKIKEGAFEGCKELTSITIPATVSSIDINTFYGCTGLHTVNIEESTASLNIGCSYTEGTGAEVGPFYNSPLTSITLKRELVYKGRNGAACTADEADEGIFYTSRYKDVQSVNVTLGGSLTTISKHMFNYLNITEITIPASVTVIENDAFFNCTKLSRLTFEESSTPLTIGYHPTGDVCGPFYYSPLSYINLKRELKLTDAYKSKLDYWDMGIFTNFKYSDGNFTTAVHLGDYVETIHDYMFCCVRLTSLWIPSSVKSIGNYAFYDSRALQGITLGHEDKTKVPTLGSNAFKDCDELWYICVNQDMLSSFKSATNWSSWDKNNSVGHNYFYYIGEL